MLDLSSCKLMYGVPVVVVLLLHRSSICCPSTVSWHLGACPTRAGSEFAARVLSSGL